MLNPQRLFNVLATLACVACTGPSSTSSDDSASSSSGAGNGSSTSGGGSCAHPSVAVDGALPTAAGTPNHYDGMTTIGVSHKRDVDPVEDGCVANLDVTLTAGGQCSLRVVAGGKKMPNGALVVQSVELTANSQCPGFLDTQEGVYVNSGALTLAEAAFSTPTVAGRNIVQGCLETSITIRLGGTLSRMSDNAPLQIAPSTISLSGQMLSDGDVALHCPHPCTTDCLPQGHWLDPATNLRWEHPARFLSGEEGTWTAANSYCAALTTGGVPAGTWRLPSIDQLRSLIRNSPATQPGGTCRACEDCSSPCLSFDCSTRCHDNPPSNTCLYWEPNLGTQCTMPFSWFSRSEVTTSPGKYWTVSFYEGGVWPSTVLAGARCVR